MRATCWALALCLLAGPSLAADKVTFGTDWRAQAEHGGFYQALAGGLYEKAGIEVAIRQGGPQVNHAQLLAAGRLDFNMSSNSFIAMNYVAENIPMVAVAALFQKDPAVLIAHPGQGVAKIEDLKGRPIMIGSDTRVGWWMFMKARFGFTDDQIRPYTFNVAPFLADKRAVQQGYLGSEPFMIERQGGVKPVTMLIADVGYASYAAMIETSQKLVRENPGLVQRFVDASIQGWKDYLNGDPSAANALIKKENPEMTDDLLAFGRTQMKEHGIVDSGDAKALGVGAMTEARWKDFFDVMAGQGLYKKDLDWRRAYTLQFVNKGK
jgi:NitT/TauT family transport system substrate-binding protein